MEVNFNIVNCSHPKLHRDLCSGECTLCFGLGYYIEEPDSDKAFKALDELITHRVYRAIYDKSKN